MWKHCQKSEDIAKKVMTLFHLSMCVMVFIIFTQRNFVVCKKCNEICGNDTNREREESLRLYSKAW